MYRIIFTKQAAKDAKNLKSCGLDKKAKELIEVMKENPFQNPPTYEKLVGNLQGLLTWLFWQEIRLLKGKFLQTC